MPEAADVAAPERVRGRAEGARPMAAGGGRRRRAAGGGGWRGVEEVEEGRERGGKRAQGRAVVYKLGLFFF